MTPDWFVDAACHGKTRLFFPPLDERSPAREKRQAAALAICAGCPVLQQCAQLVAREQRHNADAMSGIWAGHIYHDRAERTRQRSQTKRSAADPTVAERSRQRRAKAKAELDAVRAARHTKDVA